MRGREGRERKGRPGREVRRERREGKNGRDVVGRLICKLKKKMGDCHNVLLK